MKSLIALTIFSLSSLVFAAQDCAALFTKTGCGYNLACILTKGDQVPQECRASYEEWILKAHSQSPCEQEKLKVCGGDDCTDAQARGLSPNCAKEFVQNRNMEVGAANIGIACEKDFKQHCGIDMRKPAAQDNEKMASCMASKKSSFSSDCQKVVSQMFGGLL